MESGTIPHYLRDMIMTITRGIVFVLILPLAPAFLFNIPVPSTITLISGTLVIEYGAAALGVGLGLPPLYILYVLSCVALGVTLTLFGIFDLLGKHSERVSRFLEMSSARAERSVFLKKYGSYGLVPCVITLGFYVCPPVSWVLGWPRARSVILIMAGYITISVVTILATLGFFAIVHV